MTYQSFEDIKSVSLLAIVVLSHMPYQGFSAYHWLKHLYICGPIWVTDKPCWLSEVKSIVLQGIERFLREQQTFKYCMDGESVEKEVAANSN